MTEGHTDARDMHHLTRVGMPPRGKPVHCLEDEFVAFTVSMRAGHQFRVSVFLLQENEAVVRQLRNDQAGYILERRLIVKRGRKLLPGFGEQVASELAAAGFIDPLRAGDGDDLWPVFLARVRRGFGFGVFSRRAYPPPELARRSKHHQIRKMAPIPV